MRPAFARTRVRHGESLIATLAVAAMGVGTVTALAGAAAADLPLALVGGGVALAGLVPLVAVELVDGLLLVVLTAPLPALVANADSRITLVSILTAAVVFAWWMGHGLERRDLVPRRFPAELVALPVLVAAVSVVFATDPLVSGRELINFGVLMALLVVAAETMHRTRRTRAVALTLVAVGAVIGPLAVLEGVGLLPGAFSLDGTFYRAALGFGQPNSLGLFLAAVIPFGVYARAVAPSGGRRLVATAALVAMALGLIATVSRGSWLAVVSGAGVLILAGQGRRTVRIWGVTVVLVIAVDLATGGLFRDTVERSIGDWVIEQRAALMLAGVSMFLAHPAIGVGIGGYAPNLDRYGAQLPQLFDVQATPHNAYVQMAAETGVVGLAVFVWFLGRVLWRAVRAVRAAEDREALMFSSAVAWSVATIIAVGMVSWPFAHGPGQVVMLVLAMALVLPGPGR